MKKKILLFTTCVILAMSLIGCNNQPQTAPQMLTKAYQQQKGKNLTLTTTINFKADMSYNKSKSTVEGVKTNTYNINKDKTFAIISKTEDNKYGASNDSQTNNEFTVFDKVYKTYFKNIDGTYIMTNTDNILEFVSSFKLDKILKNKNISLEKKKEKFNGEDCYKIVYKITPDEFYDFAKILQQSSDISYVDDIKELNIYIYISKDYNLKGLSFDLSKIYQEMMNSSIGSSTAISNISYENVKYNIDVTFDTNNKELETPDVNATAKQPESTSSNITEIQSEMLDK